MLLLSQGRACEACIRVIPDAFPALTSLDLENMHLRMIPMAHHHSRLGGLRSLEVRHTTSTNSNTSATQPPDHVSASGAPLSSCRTIQLTGQLANLQSLELCGYEFQP